MRGDILAMLKYESTVKPEVAYLMNNIESISWDEIENAILPLPWYRIALKKLKTLKEQQKQQLYIEDNITWSTTPDPIGWMAEYTGIQQYFPVTNQFSIEVKSNTLVWFPDTGGVWIETTFCKNIHPLMANLPPMKHITKSQYTEIYRAKINKQL